MKTTKQGFAPPAITESDIAAVADVLRSGWITTGPVTKEFERQIARWAGLEVGEGSTAVAHPPTICFSSCTAALESALNLLGIGAGDEVITSSYTYSASCSVILHVGATPVLVDTQPDSYQMDYRQLSKAITSRTKAIIPIDIAGVICDYDSLYQAVDCSGVPYQPEANTLQEAFTRPVVIGDAAHSFGALHRGMPAGSWADFTAFSFHAVKNITTAEGGALSWRTGSIEAGKSPVSDISRLAQGTSEKQAIEIYPNSDEIYKQLELLSLHGQNKDALAKATLGGWEYDIVAPLYKRNMTDLHAALGLSQLQRYDAQLVRRHQIVQLYHQLLAALPLEILAHSGEDFRSSAHLFLVRLLGKETKFRNALISRLAERGIASNVHYKPLPLFSAYRALGFAISEYPNALARYSNEISLPLHALLSDEDVADIASGFIAAYEELEAEYGH